MKRLSIIVCAGLVILGCSKPEAPFPRASKQEEAEFVNAFLREEYKDIFDKRQILVINPRLSIKRICVGGDTAKEYRRWIDEAKKIDPKLAEAFRDFLNANAGDDGISSIGPITVPYVVFDKEIMKRSIGDSVISQENRGRFWEMNPHACRGIIGLSHPGFSRDGTMATVYVEVIRLCGSMRVFRKINGVWVRDTISFGPLWIT